MKNVLGPSVLIIGYLLILMADVFFLYHLMGARTVYWTGFALSFLGGGITLYHLWRSRD